MTETRRLFDLKQAAEYLQSVGAGGTTLYFIRSLVNSGRLPHVRLGRRFYVTKVAIDSWLERAETRRK